MRIVQMLPTLDSGDAVGNHAIAIEECLKKNGYETMIYARTIGGSVPKGLARSIYEYVDDPETLILYHFSTGDAVNRTILRFKARLALIYHSVTPPGFFRGFDRDAEGKCDRGLKQLRDLADRVEFCISDSPYNARELRQNGFHCPITPLPLLLRFSDYEKTPDPAVMEKYGKDDDITNILFVGRVAPNKKHEELIRSFACYQRYIDPSSRLILAGGFQADGSYYTALERYAESLGVKDDVVFTGRITQEELNAYYRCANVFLCLSEHEGFCVPLVEAMYFGVPIVAYDACAVPGTVGDAGLLINNNDPRIVSEAINLVMTDDDLRESLIKKGRKRLSLFDPELIANRLLMLVSQRRQAPVRARRKAFRYDRVPDIAYMEITSYCNFKCTFCPSEHLSRKSEHLDPEAALRFIDQAHEINRNIKFQFNVLGEPFMNREIFKYLDRCEKLGHRSIIITNISLLDDTTLKQLFSNHHNFDLVLSLQTPDEKSYRMRGYSAASFNEYLNYIDRIIEAKFRYGSDCSIEIHVASCAGLLADPDYQSDFGDEPWVIFQNDEARKEWLDSFSERLAIVSEKIRRDNPEEFERQKNLVLVEKAEDIRSGRYVLDRGDIPENAHELPESKYWGYMCMPRVYLRFKTFGLWSKEAGFVHRTLDKEGRFVFTEEKPGCERCVMANNIGVLSNGDMILCCLDYEGEMYIGNIASDSFTDPAVVEKINRINENVLKLSLCRRCKGAVHVFDTSRLPEGETQKVTHYGSSFNRYEAGLYERGGRWSTGESSAYVYARRDLSILSVEYAAPKAAMPVTIRISSYDAEKTEFTETASFEHSSAEGTSRAEFDIELRYGGFYRIDVLSESFVPSAVSGSGDTRSLGVAVFDISLS